MASFEEAFGLILTFFLIRPNSLGRIVHFQVPPPSTFLHFWAAHQFDELSYLNPGREETSDWYLPQKKRSSEASIGQEGYSQDYLFQSLDKIACQVNILSKNHRRFWVAKQEKKLNTPKAFKNRLLLVFLQIFIRYYVWFICRWWHSRIENRISAK